MSHRMIGCKQKTTSCLRGFTTIALCWSLSLLWKLLLAWSRKTHLESNLTTKNDILRNARIADHKHPHGARRQSTNTWPRFPASTPNELYLSCHEWFICLFSFLKLALGSICRITPTPLRLKRAFQSSLSKCKDAHARCDRFLKGGGF